MKFFHKTQSEHPILIHKKELSFGQRASDRMTEWMGSWTFLFFFFVLLFAWMIVNVVAWRYQWDPYPFILLNLVLSCISAAQAPVILMSEKRQAERDRMTAKYDYAVNRKAEREIQQIISDLEEIKNLLQHTPSKKSTASKKK